MKNKKGFTLIELLAVIVVLAIIMVIATTQVTKVINTARANSFMESYQMIVKDIKNRIALNELGNSEEIECGVSPKCSDIYDISDSDYDMNVIKDPGGYNIFLQGKGKFSQINLNNNNSSAIAYPGVGSTTNNNSLYTKITNEGKNDADNNYNNENLKILQLFINYNNILYNAASIYSKNNLANEKFEISTDDELHYTNTKKYGYLFGTGFSADWLKLNCDNNYFPIYIKRSGIDSIYDKSKMDFSAGLFSDNLYKNYVNKDFCYLNYNTGRENNEIYTCINSSGNIKKPNDGSSNNDRCYSVD